MCIKELFNTGTSSLDVDPDGSVTGSRRQTRIKMEG